MKPARLSPLLVGAALLAATSLAAPQAPPERVTVITGTLLGADGAPMKLGNVQLYRPYRLEDAARFTAGPGGRFAVATPDTGMMILAFTGVDHSDARVPVYLDGTGTIALDVRLARYTYTDSLDKVQAVGDWGGFTPASAKALVRQADGRYVLSVATSADTLAYQFIGLVATNGRRSVNGPRSDWYVYDNHGDYRSVIRATAGRATIVLDPAQLDRRPSTLVVAFRDPRSGAARLYAQFRTWNDIVAAYYDSSRAAHQRRDSLRYDWSPIVAGRMAALGPERDQIHRGMLLIQLLQAASFGARLDRSTAERAIRELRPSSGIWRFQYYQPELISYAFDALAGVKEWGSDSVSDLASLAYLDSLVAVQPDSNLRLMGLMGEWSLIVNLKDRSRRARFLSRIESEFPYAPFTAFLMSYNAPARVWRDSQPVPAFRFASLDDTSVVYTPASFAGKVYLLDFWATWCGPCIGDMKAVHAAYDSLAPRGLQILSISLDDSPADVRRFRAGEWKMPWLHAFVPGSVDNPQMKQLEIASLPRYMLIGRDGRILAVDKELRWEALMPTLRRALEGPPGP